MIRELEPHEVADFVGAELLAPDRKLPIVAVSTRDPRGELRIDRQRLEGQLGTRAVLLCLRSATTLALQHEFVRRIRSPRLSDHQVRDWAKKWSVYGDAARLWWPTPDLKREGAWNDHPLVIFQGHATREANLDAIEEAYERSNYEGPPVPGQVVRVTVAKVLDGGVLVRFGRSEGRVALGELALGADPDPGEVVYPGFRVHAKVLRVDPRTGYAEVSLAAANPTPWERATEFAERRLPLRARVVEVSNRFATAEFLPGLVGSLSLEELGASPRELAGDIVSAGQQIVVSIASLDADDHRIELRLERDVGAPPPISLYKGGPGFLGDEFDADLHRAARRAVPGESSTAERVPTSAADSREVDALRERIRDQQATLSSLRKEVRALRAELDNLDRELTGGDALASEQDFRRCLARAHESAFPGADRERYPLRSYSLAQEFLTSARERGDKLRPSQLLRTCAEVVSRRALEERRGSPHRIEPADRPGAKLWRTTISDAHGGLRLHHYEVDGGGVELVNVRLHDENILTA